jgi:hypothetical protein
VFESRVLRRVFGLIESEVTGDWKTNCIIRSFVTCTLHQASTIRKITLGMMG